MKCLLFFILALLIFYGQGNSSDSFTTEENVKTSSCSLTYSSSDRIDNTSSKNDNISSEQDDYSSKNDNISYENDNISSERDDNSVAPQICSEIDVKRGFSHLHLITPKNYQEYRSVLDDMYRLRHRVFF